MVLESISTVLLVALVAVALISGVGITTVGPGGIFVTVTLYALAPISAAEVAGTAHATFVATGIVGSAAYLRSGEVRSADGRVMATVLSAASVVGALAGARANAHVAERTFGLLLGGVAALTGLVILYRERRELVPLYSVDAATREGKVVLAALGFVLGVCSGLLGVGGPVLAVPALVIVGVPMLLAVAVAQVQSVFIASFATAGYLAQDAVLLPLAALVGVPLLAGVLLGWRVAHLVDPTRLKVALGTVLVAVGALLAV